MAAGVTFLTSLGAYEAFRGLRRALVAFLAVFTMFGFLQVAANWLLQETLSGFLWWVPNMPPHPVYSGLIGFFGSMVSMPLAVYTDNLWRQRSGP